MPHVDQQVGRMLIQVEQRLQTVKDKVIAAHAAGKSYQQMRVAIAELKNLQNMVVDLEAALCG